MAINKRLNITSPHKNGNVGFESVSETSNATRVNALFDNKFTNITSSGLAGRFLRGRSEFNKTDTIVADARTDLLNDLRQELTDEKAKDTDDSVETTTNPLTVLQLESKIAALSNLSDTTLDSATQNASQEIQNQLSKDVSENFNPDFDLNTISFEYKKNSFTASDRSEYDTTLERKFPVLNPDQGTPSQGNASVKAGGGFGNVKNEGTVTEGILSSAVFLAKYSS
jgi:hypothetical protein